MMISEILKTNHLRAFILILGLLALNACARHPESFYFGNYSEAERYYNKGEYERAIQKYQAYIDENPEGNLAVIAQYYIAKSHLALGHTEEAQERFEAIEKNHPNVVWANFSESQLKEMATKQEAPVEASAS